MTANNFLLKLPATADKKRIWGQILQYNKRDSGICWHAYTTVSREIKKIEVGR
jgi:hypothetical protein